MLSHTHKAQIYLTEEWVHTTGIPDTVDYSASKIDGSGNIYVTTNTISAIEKANILTTKYNSAGVVQWEVEKDNLDENDYGSAIDIDGSGNVYVAAATWVSSTNKYDYLVIKYNSSGTEQWTATYNGPGNFYDIPTDIFVDASGNVYVTGASYGSSTLSDYCTIKYNSSGTQQWASRYDYSSDQDIAAILKQSPSGRIVIVGASENSPGSYDFAMVKYNQNTGAQITSNRNSASGTGFDQVYGADVDASGNIYITGRASVVDEGFNMKTVKLDTSLAVVWSKNYDFAGLDDESHGVIVDLDNNVYITGWVTNADGVKSFETIKYNSSGTPQWHKEENSANGLDAYGLKISSVVDGNIIVAGNIDNGSSLDYLAVIYNSDGDRLWFEQYDSPEGVDDKVNFVKADIDGVFYVGGKSYGISATTNRLIKYNSYFYITPPDDDMNHPLAFNFFENRGQIIDSNDELREDIKFYTHRVSPSLFFFDDKLSYVWARVDTTDEVDTLARIDLSFVGSNTTAAVHRASSEGGEYLNYFLAHCPDGITNVKSTDRLIVPELYNDVDLEYYFDNSGFKYYIIIKPGWSEQSDPISLYYDGAEQVNILGGGELEIVGLLGTLTQQIAEAYQIDEEGDLVPLGWDAEYIQIDDFEIGFDVGAYDQELPLIIEVKLEGVLGAEEDCVDNVIWGTFYGGNKDDQPTDVEVTYTADGLISVYVSGITSSFLFPVELEIDDEFSGSLMDVFIQKFSGEPGDLYAPIWTSIIGGSGNEQYYAPIEGPRITAFQGGTEIIFVGTTYSYDLPCIDHDLDNDYDLFDNTQNSINGDGMAGYLSFTGDLEWLTYIGGDNGYTFMHSVDSYENQIVIVGTSAGGYTGMDGEEEYLLDDFTADDDGPTYDYYALSGRGGLILELDRSYTTVWETLFDSDGSTDDIRDVVIDHKVNEETGKYPFTVVGYASGNNLQTTDGAFQETRSGGTDAFIARFVPDPSTDGDGIIENARDLDFCTYYGGIGTELGLFVTTDNENNVYISGAVEDYGVNPDFNMPTACDGFDYCENEFLNSDDLFWNAFLAKLNPSGTSMLYGTYFGAAESTYPYDLTTDFSGTHIVLVGWTRNADNETGIHEGDFPLWEYTGTYFDDVSEEFSEEAGFITVWNKDMDALWSTYVGDDAYSRLAAAFVFEGSGRKELYVVGQMSSFDGINNYRPLCNDDLPYAFYEDAVYDVPWSQLEGVINVFDMSMFMYVGTSTEDILEVSDISLFPNPTDNLLYIALPDNFGSCQYEVVNVLGQIVMQNEISAIDNVVDVQKIASGIYTISIQVGDCVYPLKFIKN